MKALRHISLLITDVDDRHVLPEARPLPTPDTLLRHQGPGHVYIIAPHRTPSLAGPLRLAPVLTLPQRVAMRYSPAAALALLAHAASAGAATIQNSGKHGAVASEVAECSEAGLDILKAGGSAADGVRVLSSSSVDFAR